MTQALTRPEKVKTLRDALARMAPEIQKALPHGMMAERMCRIAMTTVQKNPALLDCTMLSIVSSVVESCQLGLPLDGVLGHAYPVPFKDKNGVRHCQMMVGYRGFVLLAWRSAEAIITAELVRKGDKFDYGLGTSPYLNHTPATSKRGEVTHAYAVAQLPGDRHTFVVMTREEVEGIQALSKAKSKDTPWNTHWNEMARKTPVRKLVKLLPITGDFLRAAMLDEQREMGVEGAGSADVVDIASLDAEFASEAKQDALKEKLEQAKAEKPASKAPRKARGKATAPAKAKDKAQEEKPAQGQPGGSQGTLLEGDDGEKAPF